jgi:hypothetical protein
MCSSSGSIIGDRWLPIFSARWTSSVEKKRCSSLDRRALYNMGVSLRAQTLVVFIFLYIHSNLIPLLCNNNNNTIKDNKIQINAGRCKYAPIRSSFQPHTPYRIMSKYKKIRVLCLYFWIILNRTVFIWDILKKAAESLYAQKRKNENRTKWR